MAHGATLEKCDGLALEDLQRLLEPRNLRLAAALALLVALGLRDTLILQALPIFHHRFVFR